MAERQLYYKEGENYYPERRTTLDVCDRHDEVLSVLKDHSSRIATLESLTVAHNERMVTIFNRLDKIDKGLDGIKAQISGGVIATIMLLAGFFIWFVQTGGGGS